MSSLPHPQPQNQSTSVASNPERTEIRNPHRNRNHTSITPGDSSGREETSINREQRQNANHWRRHKPKGSNADGSHTSPSTSDPATLRLQSDHRTAPAGRSPASAHTPSRNRNRLLNDRAVTSKAQDVKSPVSGQSGQSRRSNPAISASRADSQAPTSGPHSQRKRNKAPTGDDLTSILTFSLSNPPFPECMICFNSVRPEQPTWSCSPSEETEDQSCWNTFHLKCIQSWAGKSVNDMEEAWRARGEEKKGEWRCPGCQLRRETVPQRYWCFCGSAQDPKPPRLATPHSCGNPCSRSRVCSHPCPLPCHPGPCPPCMITIQNPCHCGRDVIALVCSRANPTTAGKVRLPTSRSCGRKCGRPLSCRNHVCQELCHDGDCPPCSVTEQAQCWCGKESKVLACGEGDAKECKILTADGEESWIGKVSCDKPCERPFVCGIHKCPKTCHPPSLIAPECPYSPSVVTHCPCGKHSLSDATAPSYFDHNTKLVRTACTDPIPTCLSPCGKPLEGCTHSCQASCHTAPCPPCGVTVVRPCRCGATTRSLTCSTVTAETDPTAFLCNKPCGALRACGHHQCTRLCCPLANLANPTSKSKKKTASISVGADFVDVGGWHVCDFVCGKTLNCGNHRCEERDHKGSCPPCLQSSFEEIICYCGRTVLEPPVSCGTEIQCSYPCVRPPPPCGHPRAPHLCHEDPTPCPPCVFLTEKLCACGKTTVSNIRCSQEKVSCGKPCGRSLGCGFHPCEQLCHADPCAPCTTTCGKPRKLCLPAQHPCTRPCHAPSACPEVEPCSAIITVTCACGRIRQSVLCERNTSSSAEREASLVPHCTNECEIAKRNARLAEALGINPDMHKTNRNIVYSDELVAFARHNGKFVELVEKTFAEFVSSDKKVQVLPHMPESKRKFVYNLASVYRMEAQMVDREPHRSVQLIRRIDTRVPANLLSQTSTAGNTLGKLADLRTLARVSPATAPASTGPPRGNRGWNSVLTTPPPGGNTPPAAPNANSLSPWTSPIGPGRISRSSTPSQSLPQPVEATVAAAAAAAVKAVSSDDAVPDNWEDDS